MPNEKSSTQKPKKGRYNGDMIPYAIRMPAELIEQAKGQAGMIPLTRIIRRLVELWAAGKIDLKDFED